MESLPIREHLHRAVAVGAEDAHISVGETVQHFGTRMAVGIAGTCRDDGDSRLDCSQKIRQRGVFAAMMSDLQNISV